MTEPKKDFEQKRMDLLDQLMQMAQENRESFICLYEISSEDTVLVVGMSPKVSDTLFSLQMLLAAVIRDDADSVVIRDEVEKLFEKHAELFARVLDTAGYTQKSTTH